MRRLWVILPTTAALWLAGCASSRQTASFIPPPPPTGDPVAHGLAMLEQAPTKDRVLWQYRTAAHALRRGQHGEAKRLLDDALARIGNIYGADKDAKKARGFFHEESKKTFIGEPYERAMANFYRGVLYWRDGEPDNARACFRNAQFMDSDTEEKGYAGDYVLFDYLDGLATAKLGGDGSDAFKRAEANAKNKPLPPYNANANVLFFLEFGPGPLKYATGEYGQQLRIRTHPSPVRSAAIKVSAREMARVGPFDDLNFQATTRGGRVMDHVLANKAVFKSTTDTVGTAAIVTGAVLTGHENTREAGLATLGVGLLSKILSSATTPAADTRTWDNLPQFLSFAAFQLPPGQYQCVIEFLNENQQPVGTFNKQLTLTVHPPPRDTVVFLSDQSITPQSL